MEEKNIQRRSEVAGAQVGGLDARLGHREASHVTLLQETKILERYRPNLLPVFVTAMWHTRCGVGKIYEKKETFH